MTVSQGMGKLTEAQRLALTALSTAKYLLPSEIGYAMTPDRPHRPLVAQGAGRVGSSMAQRLIKLGFAVDASWRRDGYPAYEITPAGRDALKAGEK